MKENGTTSSSGWGGIGTWLKKHKSRDQIVKFYKKSKSNLALIETFG